MFQHFITARRTHQARCVRLFSLSLSLNIKDDQVSIAISAFIRLPWRISVSVIKNAESLEIRVGNLVSSHNLQLTKLRWWKWMEWGERTNRHIFILANKERCSDICIESFSRWNSSASCVIYSRWNEQTESKSPYLQLSCYARLYEPRWNITHLLKTLAG
jgi:hypothetical protein